jgi:hypothetical protein
MRLIVILGLSATLAYFIMGGFSRSDQLCKAAEWKPSSLSAGLHPLELPPPTRSRDVYLDDSLGVVTLGYTGEAYDRWLHIYNDDGTLWYRFSFYDEVDEDEMRSKLQPFALHHGYFILALRCVAIERDRWRVLVDEAAGLTKFIRKGDLAFKFQSWAEYTRDAGCVDLNQKDNPVRKSPHGDEIEFPGDDFLPALSVAVKGEWLKVQWKTQTYHGPREYGAKIAGGSGWIRWLKDGRVLIEFGVCC